MNERIRELKAKVWDIVYNGSQKASVLVNHDIEKMVIKIGDVEFMEIEYEILKLNNNFLLHIKRVGPAI